jgi:hypothetical protein
MEISTFGLRSLKANLLIVVLMLAAIGHAISAYSQLMTSPPVADEIDISQLRPGKWCQVWLKMPSQSSTRSKPDDGGTIKEVTKDEIVVSRISEGKNEYRTPILGCLPIVGKYFTSVGIGREEIISRIPIEKIARIKILEPDQTNRPRR